MIVPARGWVGPGLRELWQHRDLGFFLIWRDLKVRYKQTFFGVAWAVLQPVLMMAVFAVFLGQVEGISPAGIPYPLFALAGLVPWTLFSQSLIGASNSLVNSQSLIAKVYFPRLLLPIAGVGSFVVDFLIALVLLLIVTPLAGFPLTITILWLPVFALLAVFVALAVGTWLAAINARFDAMLGEGALDEVRAFAARGLDPALPAMKAHGAPALMAHLRGEIVLDEAAEIGKRDTRRYAKRQFTWIAGQMPDWPRLPAVDLDERVRAAQSIWTAGVLAG